MPLLRITTREIEGGVTDPRRIAVTFSDGTHNVVDYPERSDSRIDAHEYAISKTIPRATFYRIESYYKVGETAGGYKFTIILKETP